MPLSSYRALDLTDEKGLACGKVIADLGADVIKIEPPGGDPSRSIGPFYNDIPHPEKSLFWFASNTNKRSITLNIEAAQGQEILRKLVRTADFIIESFKPGYMESLGLGYSDLREINPRIIMVSITPFGQNGPYRDYKTCDLVSMSLGGQVNICGDSDRPPVNISVPQAYAIASSHGAMGMMVAHYCREATGEGQWVDVSIEESVIPTTMWVQQFWDLTGTNVTRTGNRVPRYAVSLRNVWQCKDGQVAWKITVGPGGAVGGAGTRRMVEAMESEGIAGELKGVDWESTDADKVTQEEVDGWETVFERYLTAHTKEELSTEALGRNISLFPVDTPKDLSEDEQLASRDYWIEVEHPELDNSIVYPGAPHKLSETPWRISRRAPLIGEHNEEIYQKEFGLTKEELVLLRQDGII